MNNYVHWTIYTQLFISTLSKIVSWGVISLLYSCYFFFLFHVEWLTRLDHLERKNWYSGLGNESPSSFHSPQKAYFSAPHPPAVPIQGRLLRSILVGRGKWVCLLMAYHVSKSMCLLFSKQDSSCWPCWVTKVIFKTPSAIHLIHFSIFQSVDNKARCCLFGVT